MRNKKKMGKTRAEKSGKKRFHELHGDPIFDSSFDDIHANIRDDNQIVILFYFIFFVQTIQVFGTMLRSKMFGKIFFPSRCSACFDFVLPLYHMLVV